MDRRAVLRGRRLEVVEVEEVIRPFFELGSAAPSNSIECANHGWVDRSVLEGIRN